jgi:N6-L-threonylcarbamoyladenine synthase
VSSAAHRAGVTPTVLAIESSCDETAAAVVRGAHVVSSVVASQVELHARFGGVVPELASRAHQQVIAPVIQQALAEAGLPDGRGLDAIAVTEGPGLAGALLVGLQAARGLAWALDRPLWGVHHLEGHLWSALLTSADEPPNRGFPPHLALIVSGGHTELVHVEGLARYTIVGATRDDAAGEAFDKVAKLLGLGYPGGPVIDRWAERGDPRAIELPRAMLGSGLEFSFSGLKTAMAQRIDRDGQPASARALADLCASFQAAVVDVLVAKIDRAMRATGCTRVHVVGGVAANRGLRQATLALAEARGWTARLPAPRWCGDNAAMIGAAAAARIVAGVEPGAVMHTSRPLDDLAGARAFAAAQGEGR